MPDCLPAGSSHQMQFLIRIREKELDHPNYFLNCFVSFTQSRDASYKRGFSQRSLVLICKHTYSILAYSLLHQLNLVLDGLQKPSLSSSDEYNSNIISAIEVAYQHFLGWPHPRAGERLYLPFYGEIVIFDVPSLMTYVDCGINSENNQQGVDVEKNHINTGLGSGAGIFGDEDIVGLFKSLGLLPHLWTLWELVITGKDILVWAPSADLCSRLVSALVSLAAPLAYGGDFRPYLNPYDSDVALIAELSRKKFESSANEGVCKSPPCIPSPKPREINESFSVFEVFESPNADFPPPIGTNSVSNGVRVGTLDIPTHEGNFSEFHDMVVRYTHTEVDTLGPTSISITRAISENFSSGQKTSGSSLGNFANPKAKRYTSMIVGITNPFLLKSFSHFEAAIFLPICSLSPIRFRSSTNLGSPSKIAVNVKTTTDGNVSPLSASKSRKKSLYSSRSSTNESPSDFSDSSARQSAVQYKCSFNKVSPETSLEEIHERWIHYGGAGTVGSSGGSSMIVVRHSVSVKPDSRIMELLSNPNLVEDLNQNKFPFSFDSTNEDGSITESREERDSTIQNMLIREHFRHLTHALMKPFESHFQPRAVPLNHNSSTYSSSPSSPPRWENSSPSFSSGIAISTVSSPTRRIGASFLWLYRNPLELLGNEPMSILVETYRHTSKNIPTCFSSSKRHRLYIQFAESDTYLNFYYWRRRHLCVQLMMEMALACSTLTGQELIEQFAIEKGSDIVTERQVRELTIRIQLYIQTLQNIQTNSRDITESLVMKMLDHLEVISSLTQSMIKES